VGPSTLNIQRRSGQVRLMEWISVAILIRGLNPTSQIQAASGRGRIRVISVAILIRWAHPPLNIQCSPKQVRLIGMDISVGQMIRGPIDSNSMAVWTVMLIRIILVLRHDQLGPFST